ncbi:LytTR family DNA-binding domain-containing protein [uncultured Kordia sp.]|uniref:LytR/AlgR family response regulator transcription factor n=1 Tax=uncultured Kordia sp. TaxID=507699 RepID=UPI0026198305|nr:LytTR family DNA-binding domain-containing protein [uncultured Kordia sp.]
MIKAIIVEDEPKSKNLLKNFIKNYCKDVSIIGDTDTVKDAITIIKEKNPNLVFLDIELKDGLGLTVLDYFKQPEFAAILVTGYDHYAIEAIKKNALDYILKPIIIKDLLAAVEKAKKKIEDLKLLTDIKEVMDVQKINDEKIIMINDKKKHMIVKFEDIVYLEAQNQYTKWHLKNKSSFLLRNPLSNYQNIFPNSFFQIHRSYVVNLNQVSSFDNGRGGFVALDAIKLPISYRRKAALIQKLKQMSSTII